MKMLKIHLKTRNIRKHEIRRLKHPELGSHGVVTPISSRAESQSTFALTVCEPAKMGVIEKVKRGKKRQG